MAKSRVIAASKVSTKNRVSLALDVAKALNVQVGDIILFVDDGKGNIIVKKAE